MYSLGKSLKALREERNLTQTQLAHALGIKNQSVVAYWESDKTKPSMDRFVQLCDFFGVSADYLLGRHERSTTLSSDEREFIDTLRNLDSRGQHVLYKLAKIEFDLLNDQSSNKEYDGVPQDTSILNCEEDALTFSATIDKKHPAFAEMTEKAKKLNILRKSVGASIEGITRFLWMLGYGSSICMLDVIAILRGLRTPHPMVYKHIEAYLTHSYTINFPKPDKQ